MTPSPGGSPPEGRLAEWLQRTGAGRSGLRRHLPRGHFPARPPAARPRDLLRRSLRRLPRRTCRSDGCWAGCSADLAFELASRLGVAVTGLDNDPCSSSGPGARPTASRSNSVRLDAARFGVAHMEARRPGAARFLAGDLFRPPFAPTSFDVVCAVNVLDSVVDPAGALGEAAALLGPGGHLLFASPDAWNLRTTARSRWLTTSAEWDTLFARAGLVTIRATDDIEWRLKDSPRLHHLYRVHGRLLRRAA
ncbi:MAG: class I SAM-dependent methyltransferase [Dehalococcoidia bacterium]